MLPKLSLDGTEAIVWILNRVGDRLDAGWQGRGEASRQRTGFLQKIVLFFAADIVDFATRG